MSEPYNFPEHLREIVGKPLKELGFKQKRCYFLRDNSMFRKKIYFTRDHFKNKGFKIFLIVNINYVNVEKACLFNLRNRSCPPFFYQYNSEEELKQVLVVALADIINTGLPYFSSKFDNPRKFV